MIVVTWVFLINFLVKKVKSLFCIKSAKVPFYIKETFYLDIHALDYECGGLGMPIV